MKWKIIVFLRKTLIRLQRLYRKRKRQCLFGALLSFLAAISYWLFFGTDGVYPDLESANLVMVNRLHEQLALENGSGCVMPNLDPFSKEAMQFSQHMEPIVCDGTDWVECIKSECQVTKHIQSRMKDVVCVYRDIIFATDYQNDIGESIKVYGSDKYVLNRSDHVKVSCTGTDYNGLGLLPYRWFGYKLGFRPVHRSPPTDTHALNVMIIIYDSTSRNGFIRQMPKSYKVLLEELNAVVMKSFNTVGDGTPGALFPLLTGHFEAELPDSRQYPSNTRLVDDTPFIFNLLKEHGYRTAYFEDMPSIGTFQYRFNGFQHQPVDHYMRPFFIEESGMDVKLWKGLNKRYCVGDTPQHLFMLNAASQFFKLDGNKFCINFISCLSHENFNMMSAGDDDLVDSLRRYKQEHMEDTLIIVMGDHGPRFEYIRNTFQGKIEERLPFIALVLPEKLKRSRPQALKNLIANSEVLTTHYDMHATLLEALNLSEHRNRFKVPGSDHERGLSLLEPISNSRSCAEAGIMPHWCACAKWNNVSTQDPLYKRAAQALADYIDGITAETRSQCAARSLSSIQWVLFQSPDDGILGFSAKRRVDIYIGRYKKTKHVRASIEYYMAKIVMNPGKSLFEGSMQYIVKDDSFNITETDISRINAYGDEPKCVSSTHPHLNKYCYCIDKTSRYKR